MTMRIIKEAVNMTASFIEHNAFDYLFALRF